MTAMDVDHCDEEDTSSLDSVPQLMEKPMHRDEIWYVLDMTWYEGFTLFLRDKSVRVNHPGPINNSPILEESKSTTADEWPLRDNLEEKTDYVLVPEDAWNILVNYFTIIDPRHIIKRSVIQQGSTGNNCFVEVYPVKLKLCPYGAGKDVQYKSFSRITKLSDVLTEMKKMFKIAPDDDAQIWSNGSLLTTSENETSSTTSPSFASATASSSSSSSEVRSQRSSASTSSSSSSLSFIAPGAPVTSTSTRNTTAIPLPPPPPPPPNTFGRSSSPSNKASYLNSTLVELGIVSGSVLTIELKNTDGTWPSSRPKYSSLRSNTSINCTPGLCGLMNLGNTCFMNSALQCMSNCPPLTDYFLSDLYLNDINEKNPLGMNGKIARAYASLIKAMWSGSSSCEAPRQFKIVLGQFAPQFSGFQQQDCQELMASLLDGLHEDLNRITVKPYIELNNGIDSRPDDIVANESWSNYKKRNDSIIIDTFHGLLKSTLVCPDCQLVSVTFDPFCYLSLPLPVKRERAMNITLHRIVRTSEQCTSVSSTTTTTTSTNNYRYELIKITKLMLPKEGQIVDIASAVVKAINDKFDDTLNGESCHEPLSIDKLLISEITHHRFNKIYSRDDSYDHLLDDIHIFETISGKISIPVYLREIKDDGCKQLFGQPFIINIDTLNGRQIYDAVYAHCKIFFNLSCINNITDRNGDTEPDEGVACDDTFDSLFSISIVNSFGSIENEKITIKSDIKYSGKIYLAVDFSSTLKARYKDEINPTYVQRVSNSSNYSTNNHNGTKYCVSLHDCIDQFTNVENLGVDDPWYCPRCKKHQQATKKFDLWSLPKIFIIHLKRFSYSRFWRDKLDTLVDFPLSNLDMSRYIISDQSSTDQCLYDLIAVANHYGGLGGGHYTAYGKNRETKSWHYFDDSSVSPATEDNVVSKAAYVLFYQRREKVNK